VCKNKRELEIMFQLKIVLAFIAFMCYLVYLEWALGMMAAMK